MNIWMHINIQTHMQMNRVYKTTNKNIGQDDHLIVIMKQYWSVCHW